MYNLDSCKPIKDIKFNTPSSIIGIIYKCLPTTQTKGVDNLTTIYILDEFGEKLCIRIFSQFKIYECYFGYKDIVIIKGVRVKRNIRNKDVVGYLKDDGSAEIIKKYNLVTNSYGNSETVSVEKYNTSEDIKNANEERIFNKLNEVFDKTFPDSVLNVLNLKAKTIGELQENLFFDFKGICININDNLEGSLKAPSVDFVDGTSNPRVSNDCHIQNYRRNEVLKVIFWKPGKINFIEVGKSYLLRNLRIKEIGLSLIANYSEDNTYDVLQIPDSEIPQNQNKRRRNSDLLNPMNSEFREIRRNKLKDLKFGFNLISILYDKEITETPFEICESCQTVKNSDCKNSCKIVFQNFVNLLLEDEDMSLYAMCNKNEVKELLNKRISKNKIEHEVIIKKGITAEKEVYYSITDVIVL